MAEGALVDVGDVFPCGGMGQQDAEPEFWHLGEVTGGLIKTNFALFCFCDLFIYLINYFGICSIYLFVYLFD